MGRLPNSLKTAYGRRNKKTDDVMISLGMLDALRKPVVNGRLSPLSHGIVAAVNSSITKECINELTFDDFVWGSFADHFAIDSGNKCQEKAESIVNGGKNQHTVFCVDKTNKAKITEYLQNQNKKKNGWIEKPPNAQDDIFTLGTDQLNYYHCLKDVNDKVNCEYGIGYPEVKVKVDQETIREATGNQNCPETYFYSPYHLESVSEG